MNNSYITDLPEGFRVGTEEDFPLISLTLAQAFADYGYPIPTTEISHSAQLRFFYDLFYYMVNNAFEYGTVLTNEDFSAVMVTVPVEKTCVLPMDTLAEHMRQYASPEATENMLSIFHHTEELEKRLSLKEGTVYVECFAVQTPKQGQKLGSALMRQLFAQCGSKGRDIMLYTNTLKNRSIYEHLGFECILDDHEENLNSDTFFMLHHS